MSRSFSEMLSILNEAPPAPGGMPPMGGLGGAPGGDLGGLGGQPGGMPPMGGGMGGGGLGGPPGLGGTAGGFGGGEPVPIKTIAATDVWKLLQKTMKDSKFMEEIRIDRKKQVLNGKPQEKKNSLLK